MTQWRDTTRGTGPQRPHLWSNPGWALLVGVLVAALASLLASTGVTNARADEPEDEAIVATEPEEAPAAEGETPASEPEPKAEPETEVKPEAEPTLETEPTPELRVEGASEESASNPRLMSRLVAPSVEPTTVSVVEIAVRTAGGGYLTKSATDTDNFNFMSSGATTASPAYVGAKAIEVGVTAKELDLTASKVVLVDEDGDTLAEAPFEAARSEDTNEVIAWTYVAKLDHKGSDPDDPLPEGAVGLKVIAQDTDGHQLTVTDEAHKLSDTDKFYQLYGAEVKTSGGSKKIVADGSFVIDLVGPTLREEHGITICHGSSFPSHDVKSDGVYQSGTVTMIIKQPDEGAAFDPDRSTVAVVDSGGNYTFPEVTWSTSGLGAPMGEFHMSDDGVWSIILGLADTGGNVTAGAYADITIDGMPPIIVQKLHDVGENLSSVSGEYHYGHHGSVDVTIQEVSLDLDSVVTYIDLRIKRGSTWVTPDGFSYDPAGWKTTDGVNYTYWSKDGVQGIPLSEDGLYEIEVHAKDAVGNEAPIMHTFSLDETEPTVNWKFLDNGDTEATPTATYTGSADDPISLATTCFDKQVKARVTVSDLLLDEKASTIQVTEDAAEKVTLKKLIDDGEVAVGGITLKLKSADTSTEGVRTVVADVIYPSDGIYAQPVIEAHDYVHTVTKPAISGADYLLIDSKAPLLTGSISEAAADLGTDTKGNPIENGKANGSGGSDNYVWFFKSGEAATVTIAVNEPYGIKSIEMDDPSGRYVAGADFESIVQTGNAMLTGVGTTTTFASFNLADPLLDGVDLCDGVAFRVTDLVGRTTIWSLTNAPSIPSVGPPDPAATLLVEDDTAPELTLTDVPDRTDSDVEPGYERFFNASTAPSEIELSVTERTLKYLRGFTGGTGGDEADTYGDIYDYYTGLDPLRTVMTVAHTRDDESDGSQEFTVSDLESAHDSEHFSMTYPISEDGDYAVTASVKDVVGNESATKTIAQFTVDTTAPIIDVSYDNNDDHNGSYYQATRTATITIDERNFDSSLFTVETTFKNHASGAADPTISWSGQTCTVVFAEDGEYTLTVSGKDKAGNVAVLADNTEGYDSGTFTIDTEKPVVAEYVAHGGNATYSFDTDTPKIELPEPTGTYKGVSYYSHRISLFAKIMDRNFDLSSGANTLWVSKDGSEKERSASWGLDPDHHGSERGPNGYQMYRTTVEYNEDGEYLVPHIKSTDLADNTTDKKQDVKLVVDLKAPTIKVNVNRQPVSQGREGGDPINFYNVATTMTFTVSDEHKLRSVKIDDPDGAYTVSESAASAEGKGSVTVTVQLKDGTVAKDNEYQRDIVLTATDIAGNRRTWTINRKGEVTEDKKTSGVNNPAINGGKEYPIALVQDTVAPVVSLSGVTAGTFYNSAQTLQATVTELNLPYLQRFDPARTIVTITKYEGNAGRAMSTITIPASSFTGSKPTFNFSQVFDSDGHYEITAQFRDFAENLSNQVSIGEFTIDMTAPTVSIEFDNNDVRNDKYYKETRTATITVVEHNFDPSLFTVDTNGAIGQWSSSGDTHVLTVFFGEGGPYTLSVHGADQAGNESNEVSEPEFIVDLTAPELTIAGTAQRLGYVSDLSGMLVNAYHDVLEDQNAYNGVVVPTITATDSEPLVPADLSFGMAGSKHGDEVEFSASDPVGDTEMTVTLRDIGYVGEGAGDGSNWQEFYVDDYAVDADDIYTLSAQVSDQAGNEAEAALTFSVNRYGSNYDVQVTGVDDDELLEYEQTGMLSSSPTIIVREVSVSGVEYKNDHKVEKEFANATTAIKRLTNKANGYSLATIEGEEQLFGWSEYVYTIRSGNFGEGSDSDHNDRGQGVYRVNVMSDDRSSNANTTAEYWRSDERRSEVTASGATTEFILDELGPAIDDVDIPEHLSMGETYEASFHVTDDITSGDVVEVTVDGKTLRAGEVQGPSSGTGTFTFTIEGRAFNWSRHVNITVRDYAGRDASVDNGTWFWQSSFVVEGLTLLGAIAVVTAGVVAYLRHRAAAEPELPM